MVEVTARSPLRMAGRITPVKLGQPASVDLADGLRADGQAARRKGQHRLRLVQVHDAVDVARVGPLQEQPVQVLRLPCALRGFAAVHCQLLRPGSCVASTIVTATDSRGTRPQAGSPDEVMLAGQRAWPPLLDPDVPGTASCAA